MIVPFAYMIATSFKQNALRPRDPGEVDPAPPDDRELQPGVDLEPVRPLLRELAGRRDLDDVLLRLALLDDGVRVRALQLPGRRILFGLLLIGLMVPTMMLLIPQFILAKNLGLLDSLSGLVFFYTGGTLALNTFLLRSFFQESRASSRRRWSSTAPGLEALPELVLPLSRPRARDVAIFSFLASWDEFVWALTVINDPNKRTLPIAISLFQGEHSTSWGLVFAASTSRSSRSSPSSRSSSGSSSAASRLER